MDDRPLFNIHIHSTYLEAESEPEQLRFMFAYTVAFDNIGQQDIQLLGYSWTVTNSDGIAHQLSHDNIAGEQPIIAAQSQYQYTRGILLDTPIGTMHGHYEIADSNGQQLHIAIPPFRLAIAGLIH